MPRLHFVVPLTVLLLAAACIDLPEVTDPPVEAPDAGSQLPADAGPQQDGGPTPVPTFTLTVSPLEASAFQGEATDFQVSIARAGGFVEGVNIHLVEAPAGIAAQPVTIPAGSTTAALRVAVSTSAEPGSKALTVRARSGSLNREASASLNVVRLGDLLVRWASPSDATTYVNGTVALEATVEGGTAEAVELRNGSGVLARLTAPPYVYTWDTRQVEEGNYGITAHAIRGPQEFSSFERTLVVDRSAPTAETRTPVQRESNVSARALIEVTFSEPLKASTVTASSVTLRADGGMEVGNTLLLSNDGRRLTVTPVSILPAPSTLTVSLGTSGQPLTDLAGNPLVLAEPWTFTVPAWKALGGAVSAHPGATPAENVAMKLGADGMPVIAWSEFDGTSKNVHVARWNGSVWVPLGASLSALPAAGTDADSPDLLVAPSGRLIVAWAESINSNVGKNVYVKAWNNEAWESLPAVPLTGSSETFVETPKLAALQDGSTYLYVHYFNGGTSELQAFRLAPQASAWTPLNLQRPADQHSRVPTAVTSYGNDIFSTFSAYFDSLNARAIGVLENHHEQVGGSIIAKPADSVATHASVASTGEGVPLVAWSEALIQDANQSRIYFTQWTGGAWKPPEVVSTDSTSNNWPSLAVGGDGAPVLVWSGFVSPERAILVYRRSAGGWTSVGPPLSASTAANTPGYGPALVLDAEHRSIVAWVETDGSASAVYVYRHNN